MLEPKQFHIGYFIPYKLKKLITVLKFFTSYIANIVWIIMEKSIIRVCLTSMPKLLIMIRLIRFDEGWLVVW